MKIFSKNLFESIPDNRKIVSSFFLYQNIRDLLREIGFSECDINRLYLEF